MVIVGALGSLARITGDTELSSVGSTEGSAVGLEVVGSAVGATVGYKVG
jgi:hypothetical protein